MRAEKHGEDEQHSKRAAHPEGNAVSKRASKSLDLAADVRAGLSSAEKRLSCRWFYDAVGARLFEEICTLPEYYLTRAEQEILTRHRSEIVAALRSGGSLLELGSGNSQKTRTLIEELLHRDGALEYVAIDISEPTLEFAGKELRGRYPNLTFKAIAAEYHDALDRLQALAGGRPRLLLWLGSNVGNLDRPEAARFLGELRARIDPADRLLIGIDLRKDPRVLVRAYDDEAGVTARFNQNILVRINEELGGEFDIGRFRHRATYDDMSGRVQMHLVSTCRQSVAIPDLGMIVDFRDGEAIHTEDSYKYSLDEIAALADAAGFHVARQWQDAEKQFALSLFAPGVPRGLAR